MFMSTLRHRVCLDKVGHSTRLRLQDSPPVQEECQAWGTVMASQSLELSKFFPTRIIDETPAGLGSIIHRGFGRFGFT